MTKDFTKSFSSGKAAVRQTKGPGMNRGLKKKPKPKKPEPFRGPPGKKGAKSKGKPAGFLGKGLF
jgi:hypothetical protein